MKEKLIKSKERSMKYGEIFTPNRIVKSILNQPGIIDKVLDLKSTFLEPSAGEGAFLTELLSIRIKKAFKISNNIDEFNYNVLLSISTIYGIELLEDDYAILIDSMKYILSNQYYKYSSFFGKKPNIKVIKSGYLIISSNIKQGDSIKRVDKNGKPIIFSQWNVLKNKKIQRLIYTFDSIVNDLGPKKITSSDLKILNQLDLLSLESESINEDENSFFKYKAVKFIDVYKEQFVKLK